MGAWALVDFLSRRPLSFREMVVEAMEGLLFFGLLFLVLFVLPLWLGADSRDGEDWLRHTRF
jgi:hypothetical protein